MSIYGFSFWVGTSESEKIEAESQDINTGVMILQSPFQSEGSLVLG